MDYSITVSSKPSYRTSTPSRSLSTGKCSLSSKVCPLLHRKIGSLNSINQRPHWVWNFKCSQNGCVSSGWKWSLTFRQIVTFLSMSFLYSLPSIWLSLLKGTRKTKRRIKNDNVVARMRAEQSEHDYII